MSGYSELGGSLTSQAMAGFFAQSKSAELDMRSRQILVSRARTLDMSSTISRAVHDCLSRGVVGSGLALKSDSKTLDELVRVYSTLRKFDYEGLFDLYQIQQQAIRTMLVAGEIWLLKVVEDGCTRWVLKECDHFGNPPFLTIKSEEGRYYYKSHLVVDGVEYNAHNRPTYVWYCENPYGASMSDNKMWTRIPLVDKDGLPNVLHVFKPERSYCRGIPVTSPVLELIWSTLCFTTSEVQMGILQSCTALIVKTETNKSLNPFGGLSQADLDSPLIPQRPQGEPKPSEDFSIVPPPNNSRWDGLLDKTQFIQAGCSHHIGVDESVEMLQPTSPTTNLTAFYDLVIEQVGAALGIPSQVLKGSYEASYSAAKASFAHFNHTCQILRKFLVNTLLTPMLQNFIYEQLKVSDKLKTELYSMFPAITDDFTMSHYVALHSDWVSTDERMVLDEQKELSFYKEAIELGLISKDRVAELLFGSTKEVDDTI